MKPSADSSLHSPGWPAQTLEEKATQRLASDGISANSVEAFKFNTPVQSKIKSVDSRKIQTNQLRWRKNKHFPGLSLYA